jgi:hypothetical protein
MKRLIVILTCVLSACSAGGGSAPPLVSAGAGNVEQSAATREVQWDAVHPPQATPVPASNDMLYVGNLGNNSITVYHHDAQGNAAPVYVIAGSRTGIKNPGQLAEDAAGNLYVANGSAYATDLTTPSILVFAHGAKGNVAPIRVIAQYPGLSGTSELLRFPPNANGNTAPFARSATDSVYVPHQITLDSTGNNLIDAHIGSVSTYYLGLRRQPV